jgi:phenylacetate-coenzyme A ligase PaaK-like adenylate-forming protein
MSDATPSQAAIDAAREELNTHLREIIRLHFTPDIGTPFWLEFVESADFDPLTDIQTVDDLIKFPHFQDEYLRDLPHDPFIPKRLADKPFHIFETGGTTGMPKQRVSWNDHKHDYSQFSETLDDEWFPRGGNWMMVGPTGPRRLRLAIEHLANVRGGSCYFVDLDPRWVKKLIKKGDLEQADAYKRHVVDQAVTIMKGRDISCLFTTPKLLAALGEKIDVPGVGVRGVFCGGTTMTPQMVRFLVEEVLRHKAQFVPTYGNTLMGLACSRPMTPEENYSVTYYAPQPRAILRVVDPDNTADMVEYDEWGRVELTTLTEEFFMPRFLERDEVLRRRPCVLYPWDGVAEVRPFGASKTAIVEGVY